MKARPALERSIDVLVVGGGPAGAATAATLRRDAGLGVVVAERSDYGGQRVGETLSPGARPLLDHLGAWPAFERAGHLPAYGNAAAWGGGEVRERDFLMTPLGAGWHLDRRRFDADLAAAAEARGAEVWRSTRLVSLERAAGGWRAGLAGPAGLAQLETRFVVDASGKSQSVARRLGAGRELFDRLVALAIELPAPAEADTFTLVEACRHGWFYSSCLPGPAGPVWFAALMTDGDLARREGLARPEGFRAALAEAPRTTERLGAGALAEAVQRLKPVAAHAARLATSAGEGWLAVGDAAASYDPLSSSGIARALDAGIGAGIAVRRHLEGDGAAIGQLLARQDAFYRQYLATWTRYYQIEQRWPDAPFWRRRQTAVSLDPHSRLVAAARSADRRRWPGDLLPLEPQDLLELCREPRSAAEIVALHPRREEIGDLRIVLGLQWLLSGGALAIGEAPAP